jgi:hypothetical protein
MRRCEVGVQAHVLVLRRDLEQREQDDQDEDEVEQFGFLNYLRS